MGFANRDFQPDNEQVLLFFHNLPADLRLYLCTGYTDLRKSIDGLIGIVQNDFGLNPFGKSLYLFCGRRVDRIKILFFDGDCFMLTLRRMEEGRLQWPRNPNEVWKLTHIGFYKLLKGEKLLESDILRVFSKLT